MQKTAQGREGQFYNIDRQDIWNWQKNVLAALAIIRHKQDEAYQGSWDYMNGTMSHRTKTGQPRGQRPQAKKGNNDVDASVPDEQVQAVPFKDGTDRTIEAAVTVKAYNEATKHYCAWDDKTKSWTFIRSNGRFDYVDRVCQEME